MRQRSPQPVPSIHITGNKTLLHNPLHIVKQQTAFSAKMVNNTWAILYGSHHDNGLFCCFYDDLGPKLKFYKKDHITLNRSPSSTFMEIGTCHRTVQNSSIREGGCAWDLMQAHSPVFHHRQWSQLASRTRMV